MTLDISYTCIDFWFYDTLAVTLRIFSKHDKFIQTAQYFYPVLRLSHILEIHTRAKSYYKLIFIINGSLKLSLRSRTLLFGCFLK